MVWLKPVTAVAYEAPPACRGLFVMSPSLPGGEVGHGLPPTQGEDSEVADVAGDAAAGGKEVGGWAGWTDAAVMSATGRRRWPAQCER